MRRTVTIIRGCSVRNSLRDKVAQLIMPRLDGSRLCDEEYFNHTLMLVDAGIGGFILFGGNITETTEKIGMLQERAMIPLVIASDVERGLGQQISGGTRFPNQRAVAEAVNFKDPDDLHLLHKMLEVVREECRAAGIHAVFSPVADVNLNPDNPIICTRSFGDDPEKVSWFVAEYVRRLQAGSPALRLIACAKHFPGHGDTAVDSHSSLPVIYAGRKRLHEVELPPFMAAIGAGAGMIMVGHLQVPALEPEAVPATFSSRIVTNLLREDMGFRGVIVTDALDMGAITAICDECEAAVRSLKAGCDILLHPSRPLKTLDAVVRAVEAGRLTPGRIEDSFTRIMAVKRLIGAEYRISSAPSPDWEAGNSGLVNRLALKAVKFREGRGVRQTDNIACLVIDDDGDGSVAAPFLDAMKERFPHLRTVVFPSEIRSDETAIIPVFSRVSAWKGSSGLSRDSIEKVKHAVAKGGRSVVISFGSPYILEQFVADTLINAFDHSAFMQMAAAERVAAG